MRQHVGQHADGKDRCNTYNMLLVALSLMHPGVLGCQTAWCCLALPVKTVVICL